MSQCQKDAPRRRVRRARRLACALLLTSMVAGCSTAQVDSIPTSIGGLPEGAPKRSDNPPAYPAVHDMPPDRSKPLLDEDQRKRVEADLEAARKRLQSQAGQKAAPAPDQGAAAAGKKMRPTVQRGRRPTALPKENLPKDE